MSICYRIIRFTDGLLGFLIGYYSQIEQLHSENDDLASSISGESYSTVVTNSNYSNLSYY